MTISQFGPNWRSLRFNDVEQGLAYVVDDEIMDGKVLAYEYLRDDGGGDGRRKGGWIFRMKKKKTEKKSKKQRIRC